VANIAQAAFSVSWTTTYAPVLDGSSPGLLTTQARYSSVFDRRPVELTLPWVQANNTHHWSTFWANYLAAPTRIRDLTAAPAWDRCVPFRWLHGFEVSGPANVTAKADLLVYPAAISVIMRVKASGNWGLDTLAATLADVRHDNRWALRSPGAISSNRNLAGMAADLRDSAVSWLGSGPNLQPSSQTVYSVAAPVLGTGTPADLSLDNAVAASCLTGLAVLGPAGVLIPDHLLPVNSNPDDAGRIYWLNDGHAIWHAAYVLLPQRAKSIECLLSNHTELIAHVGALGGVVSWANAQLGAGIQIPFETLELVQRSALRLHQLDEGDRTKTYRSGMAKIRIGTFQGQLAAVRANVGS